ncbi:PREDICTED: cell surface glycoprotein CD200 receptor 1, partial [Leptosomus discolor]|uniref:cell surface glycoprotein CD200 receptor 1 n=1 Tax=Leptosomus discolor TaxID=188344 RepID=UPI00052257F5
PPRLTLYCDDHGNPVCEAAGGKPAAQILWVPESNSTPKEEGHDDGTVTVLSKFTAYSSNVTNTTCIVSHPAGNQSKSIPCHPSKNGFIRNVPIILCFLIIITFMAVIYYFKLHSGRLCHKIKPPETAPTYSPQDDTMEVEPYTTYVQKENEIYNSVCDLTVGQTLPQGLSPAT